MRTQFPDSFGRYVIEYKRQLSHGDIKIAYRGLMQYMSDLRNHLRNKHSGFGEVGSLYYGAMDMTFFTFTPSSFRNRKRKIAVVFVHGKIRFETWLSATNRQLLEKYRKVFDQKNWKKFRPTSKVENPDAIAEGILVSDPDFDDLDSVTVQIETGLTTFIQDVGKF